MYHNEAHLLCRSSVGEAAKRGKLQKPQKGSSPRYGLPHTRQAGAAPWTATSSFVSGLSSTGGGITADAELGASSRSRAEMGSGGFSSTGGAFDNAVVPALTS